MARTSNTTKKKLKTKPFLILPPPPHSRCSRTHSGFSFPVLAPCPSCWRTSWWARSGNKKSVLQLHYMTCLYLWEFLFSGSPFCLFTGGSHKYAGVVHWEVVITVLLAPSLLSLVVAPSEMSPWEQTLSKVLVFEKVSERRVPPLAEPKGRRVFPATRRDRSIVTENVCVVVSAEQHSVISRETSLCFGGLKTPVHLLSICKYAIMRDTSNFYFVWYKSVIISKDALCLVALLLRFLLWQHFNSSIWQLLTRCDGN